MQIPEAVRLLDPNLIYQAHHRLQIDNLSVNIGPRVITFSNIKPYLGWDTWFSFIDGILSQILSSNIFKTIERIGLRYINCFDDNILSKTNTNFSIIGVDIQNESFNVRTEFIDHDLIKILQIGNNVVITRNDMTVKGSVIDIDCIYNLNISNDVFSNDHIPLLNKAHDKEKELFFNLLKEDFIASLMPKY